MNTKLTREQVEQIVEEARRELKRPDLIGVNLREARYHKDTVWPEGFKLEQAEAILVED